MTQKILLIYPPGEKYQRGEERCQGNISESSATSLRACNDLGLIAAVLKEENYAVFLKDYQAAQVSIKSVFEEILNIAPDYLFLSTTTATILKDIALTNQIKKLLPSLIIILKGALFFSPSQPYLNSLNLHSINYLIGNEAEFIIRKLLLAHRLTPEKRNTIPGIAYKDTQHHWHITKQNGWQNNLDELPFPERALMNNNLYLRPDTGEPQATIQTSRGCSFNCSYCLTPLISGKKVRMRSPENIVMEIKECLYIHGIKNFFFRADTFTFDTRWVQKLCTLIIKKQLHTKIAWVANARSTPLEKETLRIMKNAGCWLIAFGFESGSAETLKKINKQCTLDDNRRALQHAKAVGLKTFGFFMIGFPWETQKHLQETQKHLFQLNPDFIEVHIAMPYPQTRLHAQIKKAGLLRTQTWGCDYFNSAASGTKYLSQETVQAFRKKLLKSFYMRPSYILHRMEECMKQPKRIITYFHYFIRLLRNCL